MAKKDKSHLILVHSEDRHSECSGGRVETDTTTKYYFNAETRQVIQKVWESYDNAWDPSSNYHHRLKSRKTLKPEEIPDHVRPLVERLLKIDR